MAPSTGWRQDVRDYWQHARRHYVNLLLGVVLAVIAFASSVTGLIVPAWVFWILAICFLVLAQFRTYRDVRRDLSQLQASVDAQEARRRRLLESREINNETFYVWELIPLQQKPIVESRTFTDCTIHGPAMVAFMDTDLTYCSLGEGDIEQILHEMPNPGAKQGIVGFLNCKLNHCKLRAIGIYGDKKLLDQLRRDVRVL